MAYVLVGCVLAKAQRATKARTMAARLEARARNRYVSPANRAYLQVCLGELDRAFALLEEAEAVRDPWVLYHMANDPVPLADQQIVAHLGSPGGVLPQPSGAPIALREV